MSVIGIKQQIQEYSIPDGLNFDKVLFVIGYLGNDYVSLNYFV